MQLVLNFFALRPFVRNFFGQDDPAVSSLSRIAADTGTRPFIAARFFSLTVLLSFPALSPRTWCQI